MARGLSFPLSNMHFSGGSFNLYTDTTNEGIYLVDDTTKTTIAEIRREADDDGIIKLYADGVEVIRLRAVVGSFMNGSLAVGQAAAADSKAILEADSTTLGFLPPRMTGTQRDAISSPTAGLVIYNSTTNKLNVYTGSGWEAVTSA